jgi:hypothetical protein
MSRRWSRGGYGNLVFGELQDALRSAICGIRRLEDARVGGASGHFGERDLIGN